MRLQRHLSQNDLSTVAGLPRNTIIRIETGKYEPRISTLRKIAKALGVEITEFLK